MEFHKHPVEWTNEKTARFWDFISNNKSLSNKYFGLNAGEHFASILNRKIKLSKINRILDMSCGQGHILSHIKIHTHNNQELYGTDLSAENLRHVNNKLKDVPSFKGAIIQDGFPLDYQDNFFNLIILTEVVEHLQDNEISELLDEAFRLLAPGGSLAITTPNREDLDASKTICPECGCIFHHWQHVRSWTPENLQNAIESHSFKTLYCIPVLWGSSFKERIALQFAQWAKLITPRGLIYIGMKPLS